MKEHTLEEKVAHQTIVEVIPIFSSVSDFENQYK